MDDGFGPSSWEIGPTSTDLRGFSKESFGGAVAPGQSAPPPVSTHLPSVREQHQEENDATGATTGATGSAASGTSGAIPADKHQDTSTTLNKPPSSSGPNYSNAGGTGDWKTNQLSSSLQAPYKLPTNSSSSASNMITMCSNDPTQVATGYCPELDCNLCQSSFDQLKVLGALRNITLVPLHNSKEKRRKCHETGEAYTMYDVELDEPISTVSKLVGKSKNNTVVSLQVAAEGMRKEMKVGWSVFYLRV